MHLGQTVEESVYLKTEQLQLEPPSEFQLSSDDEETTLGEEQGITVNLLIVIVVNAYVSPQCTSVFDLSDRHIPHLHIVIQSGLG